MKKMIFFTALLLIVAIACTNGPVVPRACTMEAKLCPDGSAVGRDPNNNCEFPACPEVGFDRRYISRDLERCAATTFMCIEGSEQFYDDTGCGCQAAAKKYVNSDLETCSRIKYSCEDGLAPFTDEFGCGCGFDFGLMPEPLPEQLPNEGKLEAHECVKRTQACTLEYRPVCGWFDQSIKCIKYPCAADYGNSCGACSDEKVAYWTEGECPRE